MSATAVLWTFNVIILLYSPLLCLLSSLLVLHSCPLTNKMLIVGSKTLREMLMMILLLLHEYIFYIVSFRKNDSFKNTLLSISQVDLWIKMMNGYTTSISVFIYAILTIHYNQEGLEPFSEKSSMSEVGACATFTCLH